MVRQHIRAELRNEEAIVELLNLHRERLTPFLGGEETRVGYVDFIFDIVQPGLAWFLISLNIITALFQCRLSRLGEDVHDDPSIRRFCKNISG